ncbi:hypothetical protein BKA62DRAFT_685700 [Auriculariales sp. MPI-PUGE-AT-0066]|nr:hypothetical protein BKA62DRAFT_685700 [Auriculariales sp. MPI-PUGE-AT-0066]
MNTGHAHSASQPDMQLYPRAMSHVTPPPSRPHSQHQHRQFKSGPTPPTPAPPYPPSLTSSATSARSSAYTSPGTNGSHLHDYARVAPGAQFDDRDELAFYDKLQRSHNNRSENSSFEGRLDNSRWSESYTSSTRSRSNSWVGVAPGDEHHENGHTDLGYDWDNHRDDDGEPLTTDDEDADDDAYGAAAVAMAEDGRGLIVHGQGAPVSSLQVNAGTTHLLLASSLTPNALPAFLMQTLPNIANTLVALDISANFLAALPTPLVACVNLEELNIAANPLRHLPPFLGNLTALRVLIADSIMLTLSTFPATLASLSQLHTLSLRRNKMHALPAWMCLLPSLETLLVDGNPFVGEFESLLAPLMTKAPMTPSYPPNTPALGTYPSDTIYTDSGPPSADPGVTSYFPAAPPIPLESAASADAEDYTARYSDYVPTSRAPAAAANSKSMYETTRPDSAASERSTLTRRGTAPSRPSRGAGVAYQLSALDPVGGGGGQRYDYDSEEDEQTSSKGSLRRMRSAAELMSNGGAGERPHMARNGSAIVLSKYSNIFPATMGADMAMLGSVAGGRRMARAHTTASMWEGDRERSDRTREQSVPRSQPDSGNTTPIYLGDRDGTIKGGKQGKWGFLKKMSMGKLRPDAPPLPMPPGSTPLSPPRLPRSPPNHVQILGSNVPSDLTAIAMGASVSSPPVMGTDQPMLRNQPSVPSLAIPNSIAAALQASPLSPASPYLLQPGGGSTRSSRRRSFLPLDRAISTADTLTPLSITTSARSSTAVGTESGSFESDANTLSAFSDPTPHSAMPNELRLQQASANPHARHLRSVMAYLRDMSDLGATTNKAAMAAHSSNGGIGGSGGGGGGGTNATASVNLIAALAQDMSLSFNGAPEGGELMRRQLRPSVGDRVVSDGSYASSGSDPKDGEPEDRKYKDDKNRRTAIVREIVDTERTYVKGLQELVDIYIRPAMVPVTGLGNASGKETVVPVSERKVVFNGLESLFSFHKESFLPALEGAAMPLLTGKHDEDGNVSTMVAITIANVFLSHAAFMKMYSTYINNFDNSIYRLKEWTKSSRSQSNPGSVVGTPGGHGPPSPPTNTEAPNPNALTAAQRKRVKAYLKRCRVHPQHDQINLEAYLLLPIQRIPRYKMLLEQLVCATPPKPNSYDDPLDRALSEIAGLATNMNEGKRDAEWRTKLVQWQSRIRGRFPSPLVQPHRRLIMDGHLMLKRVMRLRTLTTEVVNPGGDKTSVSIEQLQREATPRFLVAILCNDLLVLCKDPSGGKDPSSLVDLWAVLRMQTLPQPASVSSHSKELRIVDNKAILYFDTTSTAEALSWSRAINLHVPTLKP